MYYKCQHAVSKKITFVSYRTDKIIGFMKKIKLVYTKKVIIDCVRYAWLLNYKNMSLLKIGDRLWFLREIWKGFMQI